MDFSPILISFKTALASITITFVLGLLVAWKITKMKNGMIKSILDSVLILSQVLPPTVVGFFLLYIFGVKRPLGKLFLDLFGIKIAFSWFATVLAAFVIAFPLMYRSARAAFEQVDKDVIGAARTLGMKERTIFFKVVLPSAFEGIISGGILAFARGIGEFGATAMIAGNIANVTRTLPLAIYSEVAAGNMDQAWVYVLIIVGISLAMIFTLNIVLDKKRLKR